MEILNYSFDGEGMQRVFENEKWTVGIKNWKPANDITGINNLERHNKTFRTCCRILHTDLCK